MHSLSRDQQMYLQIKMLLNEGDTGAAVLRCPGDTAHAVGTLNMPWGSRTLPGDLGHSLGILHTVQGPCMMPGTLHTPWGHWTLLGTLDTPSGHYTLLEPVRLPGPCTFLGTLWPPWGPCTLPPSCTRRHPSPDPQSCWFQAWAAQLLFLSPDPGVLGCPTGMG